MIFQAVKICYVICEKGSSKLSPKVLFQKVLMLKIIKVIRKSI